MKKLNIDVIRRIENFTQDETLPMVGRKDETHVEDSWQSNKIYNGELFINLKNKKIYTSNGNEILHLNIPYNHILNGLVVESPDTSGSGIALDVSISDGYAVINGKLAKYANNDASDYQIDLSGTDLSDDKICLIYATIEDITDPNIQTDDYVNIYFTQHLIKGTNNFSNFNDLDVESLEETDIISQLLHSNYIHPSPNHLLLAVIFIPSYYTALSNNVLDPISLATHYSSFPLQEKTPKDLLYSQINKIYTWGEYRVYYKTQIIKHENNLYMAHKTFGNGSENDIRKYIINSEFDESESELNIEGYLSKINVEYRDDSLTTDGKLYWVQITKHLKKSTDPNCYKYIVGIVPNIDPILNSDVKTKDLPEININGVKYTVAYSIGSKNNAQLYFSKENPYIPFDDNNYSPSDIENLDFESRNIKEGYYLIWNQDNIGYEYIDKFDIIMHYKL